MIPDLLKDPLKAVTTYATPLLQQPGVAPLLSSVSGAIRNAPSILQRALTPQTPPTPTPSPMAPPSAYVTPPKLDYAALQAQARKSAENAVNPYYTKQLNDFLARQAAQKQQQEQQTQMNIQSLEENLTNTLQGNETKKTRTSEDVATDVANINQQEDIFQTDTGQAADAGRIQQARDLAQSGLTGGMGAQQVESAVDKRNTAEARQGAEFDQARAQQELFKGRTFEDLARSGELATKAKEKGVTQATFDLDNYIKNQGFETESKKSELESSRLAQVLTEQSRQAKLLYQQYLSRISDPARLAAAASTYGGAF
jgi:hypothetical protein